MAIEFGPAACGDLGEATRREWLVTDGTGGYAMGTVAGLRTRRYHGLLVVAGESPGARHLGLAALDPVLLVGDVRVRLGTFEWSGGVLDPLGHVFLTEFSILDGVPTWRHQIGDVVLESRVAMTHGRPAVAVSYRLLSGGPVRLEISALCTWRDAHGERFAVGDPAVQSTADGFIFEEHYIVKGPGFIPGGTWYRGARAREEAARGLNDLEDLWYAGRFGATVSPGEELGITAWARPHGDPGPAASILDAAGRRTRQVLAASAATSDAERRLVLAADQFIIQPRVGDAPNVVAGYPWFGTWSRDTMVSYEGLFLATGRIGEGRELLRAAAEGISEGMLANTADSGTLEYNTIDATLWFVHALSRHVAVSGDVDVAAAVAPALEQILAHHLAGTRYGIRADPSDALLAGGAPGVALTWMDARVDGVPVTQRAGKPVEVNALWVNALAVLGHLFRATRRDATLADQVWRRSKESFIRRFVRPDGRGLFDVLDSAEGSDLRVRPNQLLSVSLPDGPLVGNDALTNVFRACMPLVTPVGLRSLDPADPAFRGEHRGDAGARDRAYHQGTVWPWLMGPYLDARRRAQVDAARVLDPLTAHLGEWGLGSISETFDGTAPHLASGCPFQAWSVAEVLRQLRDV